MKVISFDAKLWKNGNSLLLTIPKNIREEYNLDENDILRVKAGLTTKEDIEREQELKKIQLMYPRMAKGTIIHKGEVIARLNYVRFRIEEASVRQIGANINQSNQKTFKVLFGIIVDGKFTLEAQSEKHYGNYDMDNPWMKRNLFTTEIIKLEANEGEEITLEDIRFDDDVIKDIRNNKFFFINDVEFTSHCLTIKTKNESRSK